jgi:hypothetical protein
MKLAFKEHGIASILGHDYGSFVFFPAQETKGGIIVAWREGSFAANSHRAP